MTFRRLYAGAWERTRRKMTAVAHVVERSSNSECPMSDNDSDNAHELLQRLIVSTIRSASQTPSSDPSGQVEREWKRKKQITGKAWKCSGLIIIDIMILDPVPAAGDDVDMPDGSDHSHPLHSRLQIIKSLLQTFMRSFFQQDSLLEPFKYFEVFVDCRSLVQPRRGSTFHIDFRAFVQSSKNKTDTALTKLIPVSSEICLSWALCKDGVGQNDSYQACNAEGVSNPWSSLFSLGKMVPNNAAISLEKKKRKVSSSSTII